jgi:hypothetical protein
MFETSGSGDAARPRPGDVVLRLEDHAEGPRYTLRQLPAAPQLACSSRDRALWCATVFARAHGVAMWEEHQQQTFARLTPKEAGRRSTRS